MARKKTAEPTPRPLAVSGADPFLRLMSHEMRTPLNGVIGMLGLLMRTRMDGAQTAYAQAARDSAEHLLGLVNDLLDYARLEAGALEFDPAPVDVSKLVQGVAELLSPRAHDKGLEIVWTVAPDVPQVMADEGRLRQILFNLAGNAVKFTETGGVRITIRRQGGTASRPTLVLYIDDTGPGVPESARERIFEEFGHADSSDATRFDGAGLGLAVVRKLVAAMDGSVTVMDRPDGGGARFRVTLTFDRVGKAFAIEAPLSDLVVSILSENMMLFDALTDQIIGTNGRVGDSGGVVLVDHALAKGGSGSRVQRPSHGAAIVLLRPDERDHIAAYRACGFQGYLIKPLRPASLVEQIIAARDAKPTRGAARAMLADDDRIVPERFAGKRVLLVEDNPVGALLARTLLRREGCVVETAATGGEAVDAMKRARFDLVFMDMRMPGMDGPQAARLIRHSGDTTPIIALTANAFAEDRRTCLEAGMDDHLVKPLDPDSLRAALHRWTKRSDPAKVAKG